MILDLRSDTLTKPTEGMLNAMMTAEVGDDVFGEDESVNELERKCADIFGMDEALYCPSGTMANQIGMSILTRPYEEVICYHGSHIYRYEGGGLMGNSGVSVRLIDCERGILQPGDIEQNINPDDQHYPTTSVVEIENTVNKGGGAYYSIDQIRSLHKVASENGLKMHLDGARLFNALVAAGDQAADYGKIFDSISICLSKGLGAPVGSVLIFNNELKREARRMRKVFGGAMRQAGFLAAAGIYALDNHIDRLSKDHERAAKLGETLSGLGWVEEVLPVDTNIVIFRLREGLDSGSVADKLESKGIRSVVFGPREIRFVTHLDFNEDHLEKTISVLQKIEF